MPTTIVIDASAAIELVALTDREPAVRDALSGTREVLAPDHLNAEVLSGLRRMERRGLAPARAAQGVRNLETLPVKRVPTIRLIDETWSLRENVKPFDAFYVVLARLQRCPLLTADRRLAGAPQLGVALILV